MSPSALCAILIAAQSPAPAVTKAPTLAASVPPIYPDSARAAGRGGTVGLSVTLDETGAVVRVDVVGSAGADDVARALDWSALGAVTQFEFTPAEIDGRPAAVVLHYDLTFEVPKATASPVVTTTAPPAEGGPSFVLRGRARKAGTVEPLALAEVTVSLLLAEGAVGAPVIVNTDGDGRFVFPPLPEGPYRIEVGRDGFEAFSDDEYLNPGEHSLDVAMVPRDANAFLTVVRRQRGEPPVSRVSLSRQEVQGIPGTYGDALRVIESLPGVARAPLLGGALMVRGGYPADTAIHFEGVPIPVLYHFGGFTSVINGSFVEQIDFMPGGFPVRYGNATAGIVDVRAHALDSDTFHVQLDVDDFDLGFFFGGHVKPAESLPQLKIGFAARRSHAEIPGSLVLSVAQLAGAPIPFLPVPLYYDYQLKLESEVGPHSTVSLFAFGAEDSWAVLGDAPALGTDAQGDPINLGKVLNSFLGDRFHRVLGAWELRPLPGVTHALRPWVGVTQRGLLSDGVAIPLLSGGTLDTPTHEVNWGLRDELSVRVAPWLRGLAGFEHNGAVYTVDLIPGQDIFNFDLPAGTSTQSNASLSTAAVYGELQVGPIAGVSIVPGVRAELQSLTFVESEGRPIYHDGATSIVDAWTVDPRVSVRWSLGNFFALKGAAGMFHERPRAQTAAFDIDKDPLAPPQAFQLIGGLENRLAPDISLDAQVYAVRRDSLTRDRARFYAPGGSQSVPITTLGSFDSYGSGDTLGFELFLRHAPTKYFFGWVSYTFSRTEVSLGDHREQRVLFPFDQTHNLVAVARFNLPWEMTVGGRFAFVTGNPGPIADSITTDHDLNNNIYTPVLSTLQASRLAPFHRLDLRVDKRFIFDWCSIVAFLEVVNVYNWPNPEAVFPGGDYRAREVRTLVPGLPVLPLIGAELQL